MKTLFAGAASVLLAITLTAQSAAAQTATATATFEVQAVDVISVSGNPGKFTIVAPAAGSSPADVTDATTTWAVSTNGTNRKITGQIDSAMPTGVTLSVELAAPTGATAAASPVSLSATAADLVTGISTLDESGLTITYTLSAAITAGAVAETTRTVTYTITAGA